MLGLFRKPYLIVYDTVHHPDTIDTTHVTRHCPTYTRPGIYMLFNIIVHIACSLLIRKLQMVEMTHTE